MWFISPEIYHMTVGITKQKIDLTLCFSSQGTAGGRIIKIEARYSIRKIT